MGYGLKQELAPHFILCILSVLKQERDVFEIGCAQFPVGNDREIPA